MKTLFALFSTKKVSASLASFSTESLGKRALFNIRGGSEPAGREEITILVLDDR